MNWEQEYEFSFHPKMSICPFSKILVIGIAIPIPILNFSYLKMFSDPLHYNFLLELPKMKNHGHFQTDDTEYIYIYSILLVFHPFLLYYSKIKHSEHYNI